MLGIHGHKCKECDENIIIYWTNKNEYGQKEITIRRIQDGQETTQPSCRTGGANPARKARQVRFSGCNTGQWKHRWKHRKRDLHTTVTEQKSELNSVDADQQTGEDNNLQMTSECEKQNLG